MELHWRLRCRITGRQGGPRRTVTQGEYEASLVSRPRLSAPPLIMQDCAKGIQAGCKSLPIGFFPSFEQCYRPLCVAFTDRVISKLHLYGCQEV